MTIRYLRLSNGDSLPSLEGLSLFKAVVIVEQEVSSEWQATVSRWLADSGCRYMMAWGKDCSSWDDSVDYANLEQFAPHEIPDGDFIMTTWHENEPLKEVFWFAKVSANHMTLLLERILLLHISSDDREGEFKDLFRKA
jgi:hypothetical protein